MEEFFNEVVSALSPQDPLQAENEALKTQLCAQDQDLLTVLNREEEFQSRCSRLTKIYAVSRMELAERKLVDLERTHREDLTELIRLRDETMILSNKVVEWEEKLAEYEETIENLESNNVALVKSRKKAVDERDLFKQRLDLSEANSVLTRGLKKLVERDLYECQSKMRCMEIKMEQLELQKSEAEEAVRLLKSRNITMDRLEEQVTYLEHLLALKEKQQDVALDRENQYRMDLEKSREEDLKEIIGLRDQAMISSMKAENLEEKLAEAEETVVTLQARNADLDSEVEEVEKQLEYLVSKHERLTRKLDDEYDHCDHYRALVEERENELQAALDRENLFRFRCDKLGQSVVDLRACLARVTNHDQFFKLDDETIEFIWQLAQEADDKIADLEQELKKNTEDTVRLEKDSTVKFHQICDLMAEATQKDKTIRELDEDLECLRELERSVSERHVDCKDKAKELGKRLYAAETNLSVVTEDYRKVKMENDELKKTMEMSGYQSGFGGERLVGFSTFF